MAIIVSDTSPIRALHHLGLLELLSSLFHEVYVPPAVARELLRISSRFGPLDVKTIPAFSITAPTNRLYVQKLQLELDAGESEAIALVLEHSDSTLLIDESEGRRVAQSLGIEVTGVIGLLIRAKARGHITAVRPLLERLRNEIDFHISNQLMTEALKGIGE